MRHVHILHQQVAIADNGLAFRGRATADGNIFTDGIVVTYLASSLFATELQVLRLRRNAATGEKLIARANASAEMDGDIVEEFVVVTDDNILVDDAEGTNDVAVAELCLGVNHCQWVYCVHTFTCS